MIEVIPVEISLQTIIQLVAFLCGGGATAAFGKWQFHRSINGEHNVTMSDLSSALQNIDEDVEELQGTVDDLEDTQDNIATALAVIADRMEEDIAPLSDI